MKINPDFAIAKSARRADRLNPIEFNLARRGNPKQISNAKFGIKIVLLLAVILFFQSPVYAETVTIEQKVVGRTIKIVARIAVATTNIEKTKKRLVNKFRLMGDKQFRTQYTKFYELIKDMPQDIKIIYKITPAMTREQMIENIESVDKKKIYKIINDISDKTVVELFREYRREYHSRPKIYG